MKRGLQERARLYCLWGCCQHKKLSWTSTSSNQTSSYWRSPIKCSDCSSFDQFLREGEAAEINRAWLRKPGCLGGDCQREWSHLRRELVSPCWDTKCPGALGWLGADKEFQKQLGWGKSGSKLFLLDLLFSSSLGFHCSPGRLRVASAVPWGCWCSTHSLRTAGLLSAFLCLQRHPESDPAFTAPSVPSLFVVSQVKMRRWVQFVGFCVSTHIFFRGEKWNVGR